jgi:hypothetical protein
MTDHEAKLDPIVPVLSDADALERYGEDGEPALRLTERGAQIGRALAGAAMTKRGRAEHTPRRAGCRLTDRATRAGPPLAGRALRL